MFFKTTVLKRMFKNAYKGAGLTVGHSEKVNEHGEVIAEGYYVGGMRWVIWLDAEHMPKEVKAAIIELCGELPVAGEVFKAYKDGGNQYGIEGCEIFDLPEIYKKAKVHFNVSRVLMEYNGDQYRLMQAFTEEQRIAAINEMFVDLIDRKAVDEEKGEWEPIGPVAISEDAPSMLWGNNVCYLMALTIDMGDEEQEYMRFLEQKEII